MRRTIARSGIVGTTRVHGVMPARATQRAIRGDFQTPPELADAVLGLVRGDAPSLVVEPTVGRGSMLVAALARFPTARGAGVDLEPAHLRAAGGLLGDRAELVRADAFTFDYRTFHRPGDRVLVVGNPPWVTLAALRRLGGANAPTRERGRMARGQDARTGAANFDVAEWIVTHLVRVFDAPGTRFAFILKTDVARRLLVAFGREGIALTDAAIHPVDAARAFGAQVDACCFLYVRAPGRDHEPTASLHVSFGGAVQRTLGVRGGRLVEDLEAHATLGRFLRPASRGPFRSGVKHDAAAVFEVPTADAPFVDGGALAPGPRSVFPFRKAGDLDRIDQLAPRGLVVPYADLGGDEDALRRDDPATHAYLDAHAARLAARASRIYVGRARFAQFGIGPYAFAPFKVAIASLAREPRFVMVAPHGGRPTMLDDTTYFLPCGDAGTAHALLRTLTSGRARATLALLARPRSKRVVTKQALDALDLDALAREARRTGEIDAADEAVVRAYVAGSETR